MSDPAARENAIVAWLSARLGRADPARVPIGIGDDMAAVRLDGTLVAITADMLLDGVHFDTARHGYDLIGRKAIACSLSDCAGMCCEPRGATVSLALARGMRLEDVQRLYEGMAGICSQHRCPIIGGDTTSWSGRLAIDVAIVGEPMSPRGLVSRSGARAGDTIYVSGPLGGSLLGGHVAFTPRLAFARQLAGRGELHAMMDISDGLSLDLHRLCAASGCDARLNEELLEGMISEAARELSAQDGRSSLDHALSDGEDFELLVVGGEALLSACPALRPLGRITERQGDSPRIVMAERDGGERVVPPKGYEHVT